MPVKATIGIDLGASKCCVASVQNGNLTVLPNARGENTTPSFVAFNDLRCLVGTDAKDQATVNAKNTVYGIKNILGRTFRDPTVRNYSRFSSALVTNAQGQPAINVEYRDRDLRMSPLLIAAIQLLKMKQQAEAEIGAVGGAVVSVPAYFGNSQREAIVAACRIAGLELLDLISEPTATALTYRENRGGACEPQTILVIDMGAAKLDVSVIRVSKEEVRVLAVCGDDSFGGDKLNEMLMVYIDERFEDETQMSLLDDVRARMRLKLACEEIKKKLTLLHSHKMVQDSILNQKDFTVCVPKKKFEKLFAKKFSADMKIIIDSLLQSASLKKMDIDEVVVVGGSSRVPCIQNSLSRYFGNKELNKTVNADESVATGAAILANELAKDEEHRNFVVREMVQVPVKDLRATFEFHKYVPSHPGMRFSVTIERPLNDGSTFREQTCLSLEKFGTLQIKEVAVKSPTNGGKKDKLIENILQSEIESSKSLLDSFEKDRIELENNEKAQNDLEGYCYSILDEIKSLTSLFSDAGKVDNVCGLVLDWVEQNGRATVKDCERKKEDFVEMWKKFNQDVKNKVNSNLAAIEADKQETEKKKVEAEKKKEEEKKLAEQKEAEKKLAEQQEAEKKLAEQKEAEKKLAVQQEAEKKLAEQQEAEKKLAEQQEAEKKLAEQQEAEKKQAEQKEAKKKLAEQEEAKKKLTEQQEAKKKLAEQQETERKLAEQKEAKKKLAEQQEAKKKLAEQQEAEMKLAEQQEAMKKLAEQQEAKKKLAEQQEVEKKPAEQQEAEKKLAEQQEAEKKLAEQQEAEKKLAKQQEAKKKLAKQKEAENGEQQPEENLTESNKITDVNKPGVENNADKFTDPGLHSNGPTPQSDGPSAQPQSLATYGNQKFRDSRNTNPQTHTVQYSDAKHNFGAAGHRDTSSNCSPVAPQNTKSTPQTQKSARAGNSPPEGLKLNDPDASSHSVEAESPSSDSGICLVASSQSSSSISSD